MKLSPLYAAAAALVCSHAMALDEASIHMTEKALVLDMLSQSKEEVRNRALARIKHNFGALHKVKREDKRPSEEQCKAMTQPGITLTSVTSSACTFEIDWDKVDFSLRIKPKAKIRSAVEMTTHKNVGRVGITPPVGKPTNHWNCGSTASSVTLKKNDVNFDKFVKTTTKSRQRVEMASVSGTAVSGTTSLTAAWNKTVTDTFTDVREQTISRETTVTSDYALPIPKHSVTKGGVFVSSYKEKYQVNGVAKYDMPIQVHIPSIKFAKNIGDWSLFAEEASRASPVQATVVVPVYATEVLLTGERSFGSTDECLNARQATSMGTELPVETVTEPASARKAIAQPVQ